MAFGQPSRTLASCLACPVTLEGAWGSVPAENGEGGQGWEGEARASFISSHASINCLLSNGWLLLVESSFCSLPPTPSSILASTPIHFRPSPSPCLFPFPFPIFSSVRQCHLDRLSRRFQSRSIPRPSSLVPRPLSSRGSLELRASASPQPKLTRSLTAVATNPSRR